MFTREFWLATAERAIKTFSQTLAALLGAGAFNILTVDWTAATATAAGAAFLSVLTSVASNSGGQFIGPSLAGEALVEPDIEG